jgi:hypothetical protein
MAADCGVLPDLAQCLPSPWLTHSSALISTMQSILN